MLLVEINIGGDAMRAWTKWKQPTILLMVLVVGTMGDIISLRIMIIVLSIAMLIIAILIGYSALMPAKKTYFREAS